MEGMEGMRSLDKGGGTQYTLFYRTFDEVAYIWVPSSVGTGLKCFFDGKMQPASSGDLVERWCDREQASTTARFFTSSCAKNISAGIYVVALTPRQKNYCKPMAMTCFVGLFTICTPK